MLTPVTSSAAGRVSVVETGGLMVAVILPVFSMMASVPDRSTIAAAAPTLLVIVAEMVIAEQNDVLGLGSGSLFRRRRLLLQLVDALDHHEEHEGDDQEVDPNRDEVAIGQDRALLLGFRKDR